MGLFSSGLQTSVAFFHAKSKTLTEDSQAPYESLYKSSHSSRSSDVWGDTIAYCVDVAASDAEAVANSAVTKHTLETMTEVPGSNEQAFYLDDGGTFARPWIAPTDIPHPTSMAPSYGFQMNIYQEDDTLITPTEGRFVIDYYAGIVQFEAGYTPTDMGWGAIKCTLYMYSGSGILSDGEVTVYRDLSCLVGVAVGDLVYPSDTVADDVLECIDNVTTIPAIGIVTQKLTTTSCRVLTYGKYETAIGGLIKSKKVFLGTNGKPTTTVPTAGYIQPIGYCETDGSFFCTALNGVANRVKRNPFT